MTQNADQAGDIVARAYNIPPEVARAAVRNLTTCRTEGVPYWDSGDFNMASMLRMVELQRGIGGLRGEIDLAKMIDDSFLPDDLRGRR
jgi:NitT/TauT family transport system substrate-binding protein